MHIEKMIGQAPTQQDAVGIALASCGKFPHDYCGESCRRKYCSLQHIRENRLCDLNSDFAILFTKDDWKFYRDMIVCLRHDKMEVRRRQTNTIIRHACGRKIVVIGTCGFAVREHHVLLGEHVQQEVYLEHDPKKYEWIKARIEEMRKNGEKVVPEVHCLPFHESVAAQLWTSSPEELKEGYVPECEHDSHYTWILADLYGTFSKNYPVGWWNRTVHEMERRSERYAITMTFSRRFDTSWKDWVRSFHDGGWFPKWEIPRTPEPPWRFGRGLAGSWSLDNELDTRPREIIVSEYGKPNNPNHPEENGQPMVSITFLMG